MDVRKNKSRFFLLKTSFFAKNMYIPKRKFSRKMYMQHVGWKRCTRLWTAREAIFPVKTHRNNFLFFIINCPESLFAKKIDHLANHSLLSFFLLARCDHDWENRKLLQFSSSLATVCPWGTWQKYLNVLLYHYARDWENGDISEFFFSLDTCGW